MRSVHLSISLPLAIAAAVTAQEPGRAAGPIDYVVLAAVPAADPFDAAATHLTEHHRARLVRFDPTDLEPVRAALTAAAPRHVALVMRPEQIDFVFARRFLQLATEIDDDPFVDFAFGYVTGATGEQALALAQRGTSRAPEAGPATLATVAGGAMRSWVTGPGVNGGDRAAPLRIQCAGEKAFPETGRDRDFLAQNLPRLTGRHAVTFIGHGYPREVHGGPDFRDLQGLDLDGAVVLNVACYTGVTHRWFEEDYRAGVVHAREVPLAESFCLTLLRTGVVGYTAYVCPRPAGPELDTDLAALIADGCSLGEARRRDYDKTVLGFLGFGDQRLDLQPVADGQRIAAHRDAVRDIMLEGATGGVLFGDPACVPFAARTDEAPVAIVVENEGAALRLRARGDVQALYLHCSDPTAQWQGKMAMKVYVRAPLGDQLVRDVVVDELKVGREVQPSRVLWAIEDDHGERFLQLKVNFPRGDNMRGELSLSAHVVTTGDAAEARQRGGEVQRIAERSQDIQSRELQPFMLELAAKSEVSREALQAALDASAELLRGASSEQATTTLRTFASEGFRAACVLLSSGHTHYRTWEMLKATWFPGDERLLIALAAGPPLPNYASWSVLHGLGVADTPEVRALLLQRLATEEDAGLYMSAAQGLALLGAREATATIGDRVLEFRDGWSGVEPHMVQALADLGGEVAIDRLVRIAADERCEQWRHVLTVLERLDAEASARVRAARGEGR